MLLIFAFSTQPSDETNKLSTGITQMVLKHKASASMGVDGSADAIIIFNYIIRELAHFFLYFVLGILVINAVRRVKWKAQRGPLISGLICFAYAISDEAHQMFVPGRDSDIKDIIIDTAGALLGIGLYWVIQKRYRRMKE